MFSNINLCLFSANIYEAFSIKYERTSNYYNEEDLMNSIAGDVDMETNFDYENDNDD